VPAERISVWLGVVGSLAAGVDCLPCMRAVELLGNAPPGPGAALLPALALTDERRGAEGDGLGARLLPPEGGKR
jgi:hypothetical protein